jgi:hypothetical protein
LLCLHTANPRLHRQIHMHVEDLHDMARAR